MIFGSEHMLDVLTASEDAYDRCVQWGIGIRFASCRFYKIGIEYRTHTMV